MEILWIYLLTNSLTKLLSVLLSYALFPFSILYTAVVRDVDNALNTCFLSVSLKLTRLDVFILILRRLLIVYPLDAEYVLVRLALSAFSVPNSKIFRLVNLFVTLLPIRLSIFSNSFEHSVSLVDIVSQ